MAGNFKAPVPPGMDAILEGVSPKVLIGTKAGNITADVSNQPLGAPLYQGNVKSVVLMMAERGYDSNEDLHITADVKIDGVSCLSTLPKVYALSGETPNQVSTLVSGEGISVGVLGSNISFNPYSVFTFDLDITRGTPDVEMGNMILVVELDR